MIRTEREYEAALHQMEEDRGLAQAQHTALEAEGLSPDEVQRGMAPMLSFHAQLAAEVAWYERIRRGEIAPVHRLTDIGRLLIALRIASGLSQRELAARLGVDESMVSRDERHDYYGITVERAQRVIDALQGEAEAQVRPAAARREGARVS